MEDMASRTANLTNSTVRLRWNESNFHNVEYFAPLFLLKNMNQIWIVVFSALVVIGVAGNALVITLILRNKILRKNINFFVVNMAVSDGAFLMFLMLRTLKDAGVFHLYEQPINHVLGNIICRLSFFLDACQLVSLITLLSLSVNRFYAVSRPLLASPTTTKTRVVLIIFTWVMPAMLYLNQLALKPYKWHEPYTGMFCPSLLSLSTINFFYWIQMIIPMSIFFVILVINVRILRKLRKSRIAMSLPTAQEKIRGKRFANAMKMILCSLVLYIIMWSPHHIENFMFHVISPSIYEPDFDWSLFNIFYLCLALNSTVSPLIYFVFLKEFRNVLRQNLPNARTYDS